MEAPISTSSRQGTLMSTAPQMRKHISTSESPHLHSKEWIASTVKKIITEMISSGELQISAQTPAPETNGSSLAADDLAELGGVMGMFRTKG